MSLTGGVFLWQRGPGMPDHRETLPFSSDGWQVLMVAPWNQIHQNKLSRFIHEPSQFSVQWGLSHMVFKLHLQCTNYISNASCFWQTDSRFVRNWAHDSYAVGWKTELRNPRLSTPPSPTRFEWCFFIIIQKSLALDWDGGVSCTFYELSHSCKYFQGSKNLKDS